MRDSSRKLIIMLWTVITVLVIGSAIAVYLLVRHANTIDTTNTQLTGDNDSLRRQLQQAKATPSPTPTPTPAAVASPTPTPLPVATATPKATTTPKK